MVLPFSIEIAGPQYLRYTMLLVYAEDQGPRVLYATKVEVYPETVDISIKVFSKDNYEFFSRGYEGYCSLLNLPAIEETVIGRGKIRLLEENYFNLWTLSQCYDSIGVRGIVSFPRSEQHAYGIV